MNLREYFYTTGSGPVCTRNGIDYALQSYFTTIFFVVPSFNLTMFSPF